jgi:glycosyltransferase involved in cell wall biosynthesis
MPLPTLAREIAQMDCRIYYDVSPLFEENWTGIPIVAAGIARALLDSLPDKVEFFYEHHLVKTPAVQDALRRGSGLYLHNDFFKAHAQAGTLSLLDSSKLSVGIYPSVKRVSQLFAIESSIYHDISTLITPQFHTLDNIAHHMNGMMDDLATNSVTFGVSDATVEDLKAYLGVDAQRVFVAYNGVSWPWWYPVQAENDCDERTIEPYFLVLGTREPRKNISRVLDLLVFFPELLDTHRFIIAGKMGWLQEQQIIPPALEDAIRDGRLQFPGFVADFEKYKLLRFASATIYPSYFEGFGLPVLESLSVGTPCVASFSSSIPEVGGDACFYFDPFSVESLYHAVRRVQLRQPKSDPEFLACCRQVAESFTWENTLRQILERLLPVMKGFDGRRGPVVKAIEYQPAMDPIGM